MEQARMSSCPELPSWRVHSERWGTFRLPNRMLIRGRLCVTHAKAHADGLELRTNVQLEVLSPDDIRNNEAGGQPNMGDAKVVAAFDSAEIETVEGSLSVYELPDGAMLRVRYSPRTVEVLDVYNDSGEPVVRAEAHTEMSVDPPLDKLAAEPSGEGRRD